MLVDEAHWDAGTHNDGLASADREIFMDITGCAFKAGHDDTGEDPTGGETDAG